jgi:hypothetical protein
MRDGSTFAKMELDEIVPIPLHSRKIALVTIT